MDDGPGSPTSAVDLAQRVPHRWRNLGLLTGTTVVDSTEVTITTTLFPTIAQALHLSTGQLGLLSGLGKLVAAPFAPAWVGLAHRTSRRTALASATVAGGALGIASGFAQNFLVLLVVNTLMAACIVGVAPIAHAVISDSFADRQRSRAVSYYFAGSTVLISLIGPALAQVSGFPDGWRYAMWAVGGISMTAGIAILLLFRDPGPGAAEEALADLREPDRAGSPGTVSMVRTLFTIPTFRVLMVSRLFAGHLLITVFGVQFLVVERGWHNAAAAYVLLPFGVGYGGGAVLAGSLIAALDRRWPDHGRVGLLQAAQFAFAAAAFLGTQVFQDRLVVFGTCCAVMGMTQAVNPVVNRPLVMSVVTPELRGQAFAIFLGVFDTAAWVVFAVGGGRLAERYGLQTLFLWGLVILMGANGVWLGLLHRTYGRDRDQVTTTLLQRRAAALEDSNRRR